MSRPRRGNPSQPGRSRRPKIAGHSQSRPATPAPTQKKTRGAREQRSLKRPALSGGGLGPTGTKLLSAAVILATLALAGAIVLAVMYGPSALRGQPQTDDLAFVDSGATQEVENRTREALGAVFSYDYRTLDEDFDRARSYLTENMRDQYEQTIGATRQAAEQRQATVEMAVQQAGVHALSEDTAELLALTVVSTQYEDVPGETYSGPLRVVLEKVEGEWLIESIDER